MKRALGSTALCVAVLATSCLVWAAQASEVDASYARMSAPIYPQDLNGVDVEGTVYLKVHLAVDGKPVEATLDHVVPESMSKGIVDVLSASAIQSVMTWTFNPAKRDGVAKESSVLVPITFSSKGDPSTVAIPASDSDVAPNELDMIKVKKP